MSLNTVTTGNTILASDVNQLVNVLQRPSGSTETGQYFLAGWTNAASQVVSVWISSLSRNATPVSVMIDTTLGKTSGLNAPGTSNLSANGFQAFCLSSAAANNQSCGGAYTIQY